MKGRCNLHLNQIYNINNHHLMTCQDNNLSGKTLRTDSARGGGGTELQNYIQIMFPDFACY